MDRQRYCANAMLFPICNVLYCSRTMTLEREPLHSLNAVLRNQEPLNPHLNVMLNEKGIYHTLMDGVAKKFVHESFWNIGTLNDKSFEMT